MKLTNLLLIAGLFTLGACNKEEPEPEPTPNPIPSESTVARTVGITSTIPSTYMEDSLYVYISHQTYGTEAKWIKPCDGLEVDFVVDQDYYITLRDDDDLNNASATLYYDGIIKFNGSSTDGGFVEVGVNSAVLIASWESILLSCGYEFLKFG